MSPFKTLVLGILSLALVSCSDSNENSPAAIEPAVNESTVDVPAVNDPTVDEPTVDEPTVDEPTVDDPTVDDPTVDDPTVDDPTVDEPTVDDPTVDEPTVDEPTVDEPTVDETPVFDGSLPAVTNLYSQDQIDAIEALGLTINLGDNPPDIEGTFRMSPGQLQATSVPNDIVQPGAVGFDTNFTFFNQDNSSLTVDLDVVEDNGSTSQGTGSFISGSGQLFTVFFVTETTVGGFVADSTITISGVVNSAGIENLQLAAFVLDQRDAPENVFIPENTGRLLIDPDGLSERITANAEVQSATPNRTNFNALGK